MSFVQQLIKTINTNDSLLCVGLDTALERLPHHLLKESDPLFTFNKAIIDATHDLVCAYKPNLAYYEAAGAEGIESLKKTVEYIHNNYSDIPIIADAKRADIGSTSQKYVENIFDYFSFDAVTVSPYLGFDSLQPFLEKKDKGIIILCRTSNKGAMDFQDLVVEGKPLYMRVAEKIIQWDKSYKNCLMVIGSTWPDQLRAIREMAPEMFFLVPGIGTQGGDLENTVRYGLTKEKSGLIINASRAIIYASMDQDFSDAARQKAKELKEQINKFRS